MQPQYSQIVPGAVVLARDGYIGTVEQVLPASAAGQPGYFVTSPNQNGERLLVPLDLVDANSQHGEVHLKDVFQNILSRSRSVPAGADPRTLLSQTGATSTRQSAPTGTAFSGQDRLTVPVVEERLDVGKRQVELGSLEIRKTVEEFQDSRRLPLTFDQLDVEHVAVNRALEAPIEPRYEGDVLIIPVMEEVLVLEKRLMLKEEVRISKRQVVRDQEINETLRREHLEIMPPNTDLVSIDDAAAPGANSKTIAATPYNSVDEIIDGDMDSAQTGLPLTQQSTMPNQPGTFRPSNTPNRTDLPGTHR